jgi:hypothetical protein
MAPQELKLLTQDLGVSHEVIVTLWLTTYHATKKYPVLN